MSISLIRKEIDNYVELTFTETSKENFNGLVGLVNYQKDKIPGIISIEEDKSNLSVIICCESWKINKSEIIPMFPIKEEIKRREINSEKIVWPAFIQDEL